MVVIFCEGHNKQISEDLDSYSRSTYYGLVAWLFILSIYTCMNPDFPTGLLYKASDTLQYFQNYCIPLNLFTVSRSPLSLNSNLSIMTYIKVKFWSQRGTIFFFFFASVFLILYITQVGEPQLSAICTLSK